MKLLIVSALGEFGGGSESMLYELVKSSKEDLDVHVLFMQDGKLREYIQRLGVQTYVLKSPKMRNFFSVSIWMGLYLKFIKRTKPEYVLNWMPKAHLFTAIPNYLKKIPTYWWQHGVPDPPNFFDRITPKLPAKKIGSSSSIAKFAQEKLTNKPVFYSYPGSDICTHAPNKHSRKSIRHLLGVDEETILLGNVGRIQSWKRQDLLVAVVDILKKRKKKIKLLLVGGNLYNLDDEYEEKLYEMIKEKKLEDSIITTGNQLNVGPYYDAMDIYVHTAKAEPFGIVMVEAMLHEKPLIAVESPGSVEIVENNITGYLVNSDDPCVLSNKVVEMVEKENIETYGKNGRMRAEQLFSNQRMSKSILKELALR